jgi:hypothetical protein
MKARRGRPDPAAPEHERDWADIWGKRVGQGLGAVFLLVLIVNLLTGWFF